MKNTIYYEQGTVARQEKTEGNADKTLEEIPSFSLPANEPKKEIRFFSAPKTVKKKTEASILKFQIITAAAVCLLLKAGEIFLPQLYENINLYLERLFQW